MSPSCSDSLSRGCIVLYIDAVPFNWRRLYCSAARHICANDCWCPRQMNRVSQSREYWAIAPNTHNRYLVSSQGRVRNARTALTLKVRVGTRGYEYVLLCLPECRAVYRTVHRMMAQAFLHNPAPTCDTVDHNCLSNLRWASRGLQSHNSRKRRGCLSRYRGVTTHIALRTSDRPWIASIWKDRVSYPMGRYATQEEAAACYKRCRDAPVRSLCAPEFSPCFTYMSVIMNHNTPALRRPHLCVLAPGCRTRAPPSRCPTCGHLSSS